MHPPIREDEYRVLFQSVLEPSPTSLTAPGFTAIIHAAAAEQAVEEAAKLAELFEGRFKVIDIQPSNYHPLAKNRNQ